jgi:shikimate dehydrogenase
LLNRTVARAQSVADEVLTLGVEARALPLHDDSLRQTLPHTDLLVNATSVGMHPREDESPVPPDVLHSRLAVYDIVYNPLQTHLLKDARTAGAKTVDGLGMLIYTNVRAAQICTGRELSADVMRAEALRALKV